MAKPIVAAYDRVAIWHNPEEEGMFGPWEPQAKGQQEIPFEPALERTLPPDIAEENIGPWTVRGYYPGGEYGYLQVRHNQTGWTSEPIQAIRFPAGWRSTSLLQNLDIPKHVKGVMGRVMRRWP